MGMSLIGRILTDDDFAGVLADPATANELLWPESDDGADDGAGDRMDLDKAWHGVHFLLTGTAWDTDGPLGQAVLGGRDTGGRSCGVGAPRLLDPRQVADVATALSGLDADSLRGRFNREAMQQLNIYPQIWDEDDIFDEYLLPSVSTLGFFYATAARQNNAVLLAIL